MSQTLKRRKHYTLTKRMVGAREVVSINVDASNVSFLRQLAHAAWNVSLEPLRGDLDNLVQEALL